MQVLLGLGSALCFGAGDFVGGLASRRNAAIAVTLISQIVAVFVVAALAVFIAGQVTKSDVLSAIAAGACQAVALVLIYRVLAGGAMGILTAVTAVMASVISLGWAIVGGESLGAVASAGVLVGLVAVVFASRAPGDPLEAVRHRRLLVLAALGGAMFGVSNALLANFSETSGATPLVVVRLAAVVTLVAVVFVIPGGRPSFVLEVGTRRLVLAAGFFSALGGPLFLWGVHVGSLAIVAVLSGLAPLATALFARVFLGQRLMRAHMVGVWLALASVALLAAG